MGYCVKSETHYGQEYGPRTHAKSKMLNLIMGKFAGEKARPTAPGALRRVGHNERCEGNYASKCCCQQH
jgi:hypothetical protein